MITTDKYILRNGVTQYTLWDSASVPPVCMLWAALGKTQSNKILGNILNVITASWTLRKGLSQTALREVAADCDILISASVSKEGEGMLKKFGFTYDTNLDGWIYLKGGN